MNQALENIRNRIDAFGTAEPLLFVTGNTIEVQIPGLARGTIEERPKAQFCIADDEGDTLHVLRRAGRRAKPSSKPRACSPSSRPCA